MVDNCIIVLQTTQGDHSAGVLPQEHQQIHCNQQGKMILYFKCMIEILVSAVSNAQGGIICFDCAFHTTGVMWNLGLRWGFEALAITDTHQNLFQH